MDDQDPFDWDVEKVIHELTARTDGVMSGMVAESFRFNEVTGKILLTAVTMENLKSDLGIGPLGRRGKVFEQVESLRQGSAKYHLHIHRSHASEQTSLIRPINLPDVRPICNLHSQPSLPAVPFNSNPEENYVFFSNPAAPPQLKPYHPSTPSPYHASSRTPPGSQLVICEQEPENNDKENLAGDGQELAERQFGSPAAQVSQQEPGAPQEQDSMDSIMTEAISKEPIQTKPVFGVVIQQKQRRHRLGANIRNRGYLGSKALLVDDLFYSGRDIEQEHEDSDSEDDEFLVLSSGAAPGTQRYVAAQMQHFLKSAETARGRTNPGHLRAATKPYKASLLKKHYVQSITVYDACGDSCKVYKSTVDDLRLEWGAKQSPSRNDSRITQFGDNPLDQKYGQVSAEPSKTEWDFLMKWTKIADDRLLPPFNESDSENDYDLETWNEMMEEAEERELALMPKVKSIVPVERHSTPPPHPKESTKRAPAESVDIISRSPASVLHDINIDDGGEDAMDDEDPLPIRSPKNSSHHVHKGNGKRSDSGSAKSPPIDVVDLTGFDSEVEAEVELQGQQVEDADSIVELTSEDDVGNGRRKRKQTVLVEDTTAKASRETTHRFVKARAARIKNDEKRRRQQGLDVAGVVVNKGKYANENDIFFDPQIEERLKPHQIEGIQFMWQELIQSKRNMGALLAHTMGLGKTFQVIALLHTIAAAGASTDPKTFKQIPPHLRKSKSLILCPPGLVDNWWDEFHQFLPMSHEGQLDTAHTGKIYKIAASTPYRDEQILEWNKNGGIMIISNRLFGNYVTKNGPMKDILLQGPGIIVADEAHFMKNPSAAITKAASQFKSTSRIAISGSPLQNYLSEYWTMIEWIDPGYLGPLSEFEAKYARPIQDGLHTDSTRAEQRQSLKMLYTLKVDLGPKVHRMDITAISNLLPAKREFLITLPLTDIQKRLYIKVIDIIKEKSLGHLEASHLLLLVNCHPQALVANLIERKKEKGTKRHKRRELDQLDEVDAEPGHDIDTPLNLVEPILNTVQNFLAELNYPLSRKHSHRTEALRIILLNAIEARDRVLVFSHSIPTMDVLEKLMRSWKINYKRLDGNTPMAQRQQSTKDFNTGDGDVYLISTKAGGLGLNLFGANRVVIFDFRWSPSWEQQAVGRAYRIGQKKPVYVYRFFAGGTIEDYFRNLTDFKAQLATRVVDKKDPMRNSSKLAKLLLKQPENIEKHNLDEYMGKDPVVLDHLIEKNYVRNIKSTETFIPDLHDTLTEEEQREAENILLETKRLRTEPGATPLQARQAPSTPANIPRGVPTSSHSKPPVPTKAPLPFKYGSPDGSTSSDEDEPQHNFPLPIVAPNVTPNKTTTADRFETIMAMNQHIITPAFSTPARRSEVNILSVRKKSRAPETPGRAPSNSTVPTLEVQPPVFSPVLPSSALSQKANVLPTRKKSQVIDDPNTVKTIPTPSNVKSTPTPIPVDLQEEVVPAPIYSSAPPEIPIPPWILPPSPPSSSAPPINNLEPKKNAFEVVAQWRQDKQKPAAVVYKGMRRRD